MVCLFLQGNCPKAVFISNLIDRNQTLETIIRPALNQGALHIGEPKSLIEMTSKKTYKNIFGKSYGNRNRQLRIVFLYG